ncbi:MAG: TRAP transporter substrate-binding protein [Desulfobacula sp.]|jgi:TRAP-type C4-dicarboxylate transport system substrate-binding protein
MKRLSAVFVLSVFLVSLFYVSFPAASLAADGPIKLNYSNFFPAPHKNSQLSEAWCREVEKRTNGKVAISYFPGGTLTPAAQTYDSVVTGIADIGFSVFGYTAGKFPLTEVIDLPLGYKSGSQATALINAFYTKFQPKELDDVKVLYLHGHGPGLLHSKKPVATLDEIKGMKVRATGVTAKIVTAFGGAPVGITMPETYESLRSGVVEGVMCPIESLKGWKLGEVVSSTTLNYASAYSTAMFIIMNKAKWATLPPDVQKVFEEVNQEWSIKQGKTWDEIDLEGLEFIKAKGNKVITLSPEEDAKWAEKVKPLLDGYVANAKSKGLPGDEALKFCLDFLKK